MMRDYCFVYLLGLSVMVPEQVIFNSAQSASKRKKERNIVINKLRTLSHSNTEGKEICFQKIKIKTINRAYFYIPGMPLCIVCVRCLCNFVRVLPLYIELSLALRGNGRTFLISRSG